MRAAGAAVQRVEIERDGKVVVFTGPPPTAPPTTGAADVNEWDTVQ